jgi:hypothetical protein
VVLRIIVNLDNELSSSRKPYPSLVVHLEKHHNPPARHIGQVLYKSVTASIGRVREPTLIAWVVHAARRTGGKPRLRKRLVGPGGVRTMRARTMTVSRAFAHASIVFRRM